VDEVVLSLAIEPQPRVVLGPRIPALLGEKYSQFPKIEAAPPYQIAPEFESPRSSILGGVFEFPTIQPRHWLISDDDTLVLQVQTDYLALNWRRRGDAQYVKYDALRSHFLEVAGTLAQGIESFGGRLAPVRAELTYINVLKPGPMWQHPREIQRLFNIKLPEIGDVDNLALNIATSIRDQDKWIGRLHLSLATGYDWATQDHSISLNLTARSGEFQAHTLDEGFSFLDAAHDASNRAFRELLSGESREEWGWTE
jgi:uncharacterized protein (TIGR04255 family)